VRILIAILTTGVRNTTFEECLQSILEQKVPASAELGILIVENNRIALDSIQEIITRYQKTTTFDIHHSIEINPGIPFARNRALTEAKNRDYSHLGFIDDDAFALNNWLEELTVNMEGYDVVAGPQCAVFPDKTSNFYQKAKIYNERVLPDQVDIRWAATNNILMSVAVLTRHDLCFNEALIHGGEDKELFLRVSMNGGKLQWRANAIIKEHIVKKRLNIKWAVKRTFRMGATGFQIESCNKNSNKVYLTCFFKGSIYFTKGLISLIPFAISPKHSTLDCLCDLSHGVGFIYGLFTKGKVKSYA
jgi:succinoglycan biosynthesis protein ExoM